ncbi:hypothetical protein PM082_023787 [Marasmius tenuissimus]|nr:hypothetical protein PM082_023787 [Marasmius tenuissimus]
MGGICRTCKFTPSIRYPPISKDQFRKEFAIPDATLIQMASIIEEEEERDIEHCNGEILRLQNILESLQSEKKALEEQVAQRRSYISPMRRVPHELWVEIFSMCISEQQQLMAESESKEMKKYNCTDKDWHTMFATPFRLAGVCLRWRIIVNSTPALWSRIFYNLLWEERRPGLELYLERSEGHDLDISHCGVWSSGQRLDYQAEQRIEHSSALAF